MQNTKFLKPVVFSTIDFPQAIHLYFYIHVKGEVPPFAKCMEFLIFVVFYHGLMMALG
jgi:hypothetical protein